MYNTLGYGFLERVYQNALYFELIEQGFKCEVQKQINVFYKNHKVGEYYADMVINNSIILELKAADAYVPNMNSTDKLSESHRHRDRLSIKLRKAS